MFEVFQRDTRGRFFAPIITGEQVTVFLPFPSTLALELQTVSALDAWHADVYGNTLFLIR